MARGRENTTIPLVGGHLLVGRGAVLVGQALCDQEGHGKADGETHRPLLANGPLLFVVAVVEQYGGHWLESRLRDTHFLEARLDGRTLRKRRREDGAHGPRSLEHRSGRTLRRRDLHLVLHDDGDRGPLDDALDDGGLGLHRRRNRLLDGGVRDLEDLVPAPVIGERHRVIGAILLDGVPELVARVVGHPRATLENREKREGHDLHLFGANVDTIMRVAACATHVARAVPLDGVAVVGGLEVSERLVGADDIGPSVSRAHEARGLGGGLAAGRLRSGELDLRGQEGAQRGEHGDDEEVLDAVHDIPS